jgi:superfamily I DNA/RNA helicase
MKRRIARLLESGVNPSQILAVTFTRVAAEDLHRELSSMDVQGADGLQGRTVHSLAMSILMRNHVLPTLDRVPRPLNEYELNPLLEDLGAQHGSKHDRKRHVKAYEAGWARLQHEQPGHAQAADDAAFAAALLTWLHLHEAMLIGEVIPQLYQYLRLNPAAPELAEFNQVLIDEYQDLNRVEQEVLSLLGARASVCVVGDDDQSIYSFKHAHPDGVRQWTALNAGEDHAIADCRRCPTTVVRMANTLIAQNQHRTPRVMTEMAANGPGIVEVRQYANAAAEAEAVASKIIALVGQGVAPGDIIVLAQRSTFGTPVFERLRNAGVPSKSYYAEAALAGDYAQERFALLKLAINPEDRVALRWLLGFGHARWQAPAYARVAEHIRTNGDSPNGVMARLERGELHLPHTQPLVERYRIIMAEVARLQGHAGDLQEFLGAWLPQPARAPLLHEAAQAQIEGAADLEDLLEKLTAAITQPEVPAEVAEVRVMSLHKSKGLSSPFVFIVGCVEGLVPGAAADDATPAERVAKLEEDRRLFYVGITRVKAANDRGLPGYLALTYPQTMGRAEALQSQIRPVGYQGQLARLQPSRFLADLGPSAPAALGNAPL